MIRSYTNKGAIFLVESEVVIHLLTCRARPDAVEVAERSGKGTRNVLEVGAVADTKDVKEADDGEEREEHGGTSPHVQRDVQESHVGRLSVDGKARDFKAVEV